MTTAPDTDIDAGEIPGITDLDPSTFNWTDGTSDHEAVAKAADYAQGVSTPTDVPLIGEPSDTTVRLPGGYVDPKGERFRTAEVRELTGEDEEALGRAVASGRLTRYQQVLLERGVVSVGPHQATPELLNSMLTGDRDALIVGIRVATYGEDVEMEVKCPVMGCGVEATILVNAREEIPMKLLQTLDVEHRVPLRKGHFATVRLVTGGDLNALADAEDATVAEQNSLILSRVVLSVDGVPWTGDRTTKVKTMGMSDRRAILKFLSESQPGPQFSDVKYACSACGKEMTLGLSVRDLFPGS